MQIKQGIVRKVASMLATGATLLACTSIASAAEPREYDISQVGTASLSSLTRTANGQQQNLQYVTPDGKTVTGDRQLSGDGNIQIGLDITLDLQNVKPGDRINVPLHTTDDSYAPIYVGTLESSGYLSANGRRVFTVKSTGTRSEGGSPVMDNLTLTALNSVSKLTGKASMSITLGGNVYPGRSNHFGRTSTFLTVGDKTYTIPNPKQTLSANWRNAARAIGVSSMAGTEILQLSADSYGWENSILAGDQYSSLVQQKLKTNRVVLARITPGETGTEIKSITPVASGIVPDDLPAGYDATTWSNTFIESKKSSGTLQLATLTAADMGDVDTVASKLPAHQAAIVQSGNVWYVAVNFGAMADDPKLPASQSGYGDATTQTFYDNVRAKSLPYPSMTASFTVKFNDPTKKQTAKMDRYANTEWKSGGVQNNWETKVYHQGWDLASTPVGDSSGTASSAVTVDFDANGGTSVDSQKVKPGDTVAEPYTQRDGCTFGGWYLNGVKYDFDAPVTRDITLKANWITSHTVTFDANGGSTVGAQTVDDKAKAKEPTSTRSGWTLDGWYLDGVKYDFNTPVTKDITLKAGWRKTGVTTAKADLHKRLATGSKNGQYKLTLDVKGSAVMRNTTITDPLSKWVNPVGLTDGKGTGITVTKDGKAMTSGYTAAYDAKSRTVKVSVPGDLADGSVYAASFEVVMSDAAKSDYMLNGKYPNTGDADTGLNAGQKGYFTNGDATLTWDAATTVNGAPSIVPSKAAYPKPAAAWSEGGAPSVLTNHLPGTGGTASLVPVIAGMGIAIAIAAAWVIRRRLA